MAAPSDTSTDSLLLLNSARETNYPKEDLRDADFLFVDSEIPADDDEDEGDVSTRSAPSGLMADYDVSISFDLNKDENSASFDVNKNDNDVDLLQSERSDHSEFESATDGLASVDNKTVTESKDIHHSEWPMLANGVLSQYPDESASLNTLLPALKTHANQSATPLSNSERNLARVEPQVNVRTTSTKRSSRMDSARQTAVSLNDELCGGTNVAGDNISARKGDQAAISDVESGVKRNAEELEAVAGELRQGLGLVFEQLNKIVDGDTSLAKQLDSHRAELAEVCRLAVGLRSDMSTLTSRQERLESEMKDLKMELGIRYSTASESSLVPPSTNSITRRQGDGASSGCLDNAMGGSGVNKDMNRALSPKYNCANSRLSSIRSFKTLSKASVADNNDTVSFTSATHKSSTMHAAGAGGSTTNMDNCGAYPSSASTHSSSSHLTNTITRADYINAAENFDKSIKESFMKSASMHTELYELLHHYIGHYLKTSRKMESCIQKSEYSQFNARLTFPSVLRAIKECNQQLWKSWNACVECLQDRNSCSSVSGGNSRIVLRETFAENLLSALRLFMDNDLEKIYINGCRSYFESIPTSVSQLKLSIQNSATFANYIEDQARSTRIRLTKLSHWDPSQSQGHTEVMHWMMMLPYRMLKLDQSFLDTASNFLTKCTCPSHLHHEEVAERDDAQPQRESRQPHKAVSISSTENGNIMHSTPNGVDDNASLICSESAMRFTPVLRMIHEVSTQISKCMRDAETVLINCRDVECDLSSEFWGEPYNCLSSESSPLLPDAKMPLGISSQNLNFVQNGSSEKYQNEDIMNSYLNLNKILNSQMSTDTVVSEDVQMSNRGIPKSQTIQDFAQVQVSNCATPTNKLMHSSSSEFLNKSLKRELKTIPRDLFPNDHYANCKCELCFDRDRRDNQLVPSMLYENNLVEFEQYELEKSKKIQAEMQAKTKSATSEQLFEDLENICLNAEMTVKCLLPFKDLKDMIRNDHTVMNNEDILIKETGDQLVIHQKLPEEKRSIEPEKEPVSEHAYQITDITNEQWMDDLNHVVPANTNSAGQKNLTDAKMYYHRYIMPYQKARNVAEPPQKDDDTAKKKKTSSQSRSKSKAKKSSTSQALIVDDSTNLESYEQRTSSLSATWNKVRSRTPSLKSDLCGGLLSADNSDLRDYYNMSGGGFKSGQKDSGMSKSEQNLAHTYGYLVQNHDSDSREHGRAPDEMEGMYELQNGEDNDSLPYTKSSPKYRRSGTVVVSGSSNRVPSGCELTPLANGRTEERKTRSKSLKNLFGMKSRDKRSVRLSSKGKHNLFS
ncbi:uncharacterized protein LOC134845576 isoform X3 [Symsagittifera roscoffensis]|uniref:uncharacterized protein LOC134845576 isoform X3 n=1 Tax=Symsagittifera roscoffensis TaxID=84072 RepID=UPI00307B2F6D